ncbi:glycosyltransferase family 4 protein [Bacillus sp. 1P10SD]|uniref:glycosyltransferase family 4 protein n=1 Tax=Bacillus sp. 1P10SD TaxID=3132265 RepID=UPI0039A4E33B
MKKIIVINHYGLTPDLPGATKHYDMAKYFSDQKTHNIEFWMCGYNHHTGINHEDLKGLKIQAEKKDKNLNIVRIKSTPYRKSSILRQLNITFFDIITSLKILFSKNIDAIVLSVPPISIFNVWAAKFRKVKLITDVEDLWPLFLIEMGLSNNLAIKYMESAANYTYKVSDGIAAVSKGMEDYVRNQVSGDDKVIWLSPLGVNLNEYSNKTKDLSLVENKVWKNDFKIMYIGAHGRANDLSAVLTTIKSLNEISEKNSDGKQISFIFIGDGDQKSNLIKLSKELSLNNVFFEDPIPGKLVPDYLAHSDICLTNLKKIESFKLVRPNKIFQYMAVGIPIVTGIWGEAKSIVEEAKSGIYIDFNQNQIAAETLLNFINDSSALGNYSFNGKKYVKEHGNREKIFERFYRNILKIISEK